MLPFFVQIERNTYIWYYINYQLIYFNFNMLNNKGKWVHFIGICGVTMAPLANVYKLKGYTVTGSDKGIFPPMSDYLKRRKINIELGFKKEHLDKNYYLRKGINLESKYPDIVIVGNRVWLSNIEYKYACENNLKIKSFPEILEEQVVKSNSIVVAGTYGKTTSTAILAYIFEKSGKKPSFMIGGLAKNFKDGIRITNTDWSIIEGDEYISSRFDPESKFFHYKARFVLLTSCAWEHTDYFKTEESYISNFKKLIGSLPNDGLLVANLNGPNVDEVIKYARCKVITYELNLFDDKLPKADWFNLPHKESNERDKIVIFNKNTREEITLKTLLIGDHNKENIIGCTVLARELGIKSIYIEEAVRRFKGIKRRLEIILDKENLKIIDDHACSPFKVRGSLKALRNKYENWYITIIFEPNIGNMTKKSLKLFDNVFNGANEIIIPRIKLLKSIKGEKLVNGNELSSYLSSIGVNSRYIDNDSKLVKYIVDQEVGKRVICFMGAYSFREMQKDFIRLFECKLN